MRLTDTAIRAAQPKPGNQYTQYCETFSGFGLRVSPGGTKSFVYVYRQYGQKKRSLLGRYPDISLAQARDKATRIRARLALQVNEPSRVSFIDALELYRATHLKSMRVKVQKEQDRILTKYWECHHHQPLALLDKGQIAKVLDDLADTPIMARNARSALRTFINWAHTRDYCQPFPRLPFRAKNSDRDRTLNDAELTAIWKACEDDSFGSIVRLLMLTGQRRGEIAALRGPWVDLADNTVTLPSSITKNKIEHEFPITGLALGMLQELADEPDLLFPSLKTGELVCGWAKIKLALDRRSGITGWTLHDLRRTFSTKLADLGVAPHVVERCLNHQTGTLSPIAKRYNRHRYLTEMRDAFETYDRYISSLITAK